jgi:uncharacterized membrane protein YoaK (UPF0700 family)
MEGMYRLDREEFVRPPYVWLWSLLGFQAGFLNAFGFLACGRFVSHMTGFGTQIGVTLASGKYWFALEFLGFPLSFILGSFVSGILTIARIERGLRPRFEGVMAVIPLIIAFLWLTGHGGLFGPFGEQLILSRDFILLFLLTFVCGMQNGCFATMTRGQIRTTHLTGISTDLGTDLARLLLGKIKGPERSLTESTNFSRFATFFAFSLGSTISVFMSQGLAYGALVVPLLTSVGVFLAIRKVSRILDEKLARAGESATATPMLSGAAAK